jgi:hypothetical protein
LLRSRLPLFELPAGHALRARQRLLEAQSSRHVPGQHPQDDQRSVTLEQHLGKLSLDPAQPLEQPTDLGIPKDSNRCASTPNPAASFGISPGSGLAITPVSICERCAPAIPVRAPKLAQRKPLLLPCRPHNPPQPTR